MNRIGLWLSAVSLCVMAASPAISGDHRICLSRCHPSHQSPATAKAQTAPLPAPNYSTTTTDNSISYVTNIQYGQLPGAQGQTVYGYQDRAYTYAATDLGVDNLISQRLVADAHAIQSGVLEGQQARAASAAEIAKLQIKGQIITSALNALADTSSGSSSSTEATFKQEIHAGGASSVSQSPSALAERVAGVFSTKCVSCHGPTRQAGGLDLSNLANLDAAAGAKILARIVNPDPTKRMPFGPGDVPGVPLTLGETSAMFQAVGPIE